MSKEHKRVCTTLKLYWTLILGSAITECVSISAVASLVRIPIGITSSAIWLKICAVTAAIKKYKSIIKTKKKKKRHKIVLLSKFKLNRMEVLISDPLANLVISHDEFVLINNMLKEYNEMKEEIENLKAESVYRRF